MTVGPDEAKKLITMADKKKVDALEKKIDDYLKQNYDGGNMVIISVSNDSLPRNFAMKQLFGRYQSAGWSDVRIESDQREGTYIRLSYTTKSDLDQKDWPNSQYGR